ncbi:DUF3820 family protein [Neisseria sp. Ec49-e6-T10]|uniref:DUF3820 family protein n=1 Tax=Neisseria sp. Ec49-e6-T10 TaxID=3140744 RepID=UPI003EB92AB4
MQPEDLIKLTTQTMPYGKYKGLLLSDLPEHYVAFLVREALPKGALGELILLLNELQINGLMYLIKPLKEN